MYLGRYQALYPSLPAPTDGKGVVHLVLPASRHSARVRRMNLRLLSRSALALLVALIAASCERLDVGPELAGELGRARDDARGVLAIAADSASASSADSVTMLAILYLERHRLGLGSPFRLIDYAMSDPRLDDQARRRVGWMLLARTLDGNGHVVDPAALGLAATKRQDAVEAGASHALLINRTVAGARDARAGEVAVRVAYAIAAAEGTVSQWTPAISARAAAVARDREVARDDARTLLRAARAQGTDPLALVPFWRSARRFQVEQPAMVPLAADAEREALELVPHVTDAIRSTAETLVLLAADSGVIEPDEPQRDRIAGLTARRLTEFAAAAELPPQAPVVVSVSAHRSRLMERRELEPATRRARNRFVDRAVNEETLAAEYALLRQAGGGATAPALAALAAAVSLRAYSQEEIWWPGMPSPTVRDLRDRFALGTITFDQDVPATWRGYYTRMLSFALSDLQRVMPALKLRGLALHIGDSPMRSEALALHDPRARVIYLPLATSAGTLAHEVAHDLDWQVARARYGTRGEYASDRAIRDRDGSPLAQSLQGLTSATLIPPLRENNHRPPHDSRPAEVFARSVDWFVAVSLAREGRSNGYLSSVQDDVLTGYVTVAPPDVTGEAGEALVRILDDVAPVASSSRDWFLAQYGVARSHGPYDLTRKVLEYPVSVGQQFTLYSQLAEVVAGRNKALAAINVEACRSRGAFDDRRLASARTRVAMLAAEARARGLINASFEARLRLEVERFAARQALLGAPSLLGSFEPLPAELVQAMLEQARLLEQVSTPLVITPKTREPCVVGGVA